MATPPFMRNNGMRPRMAASPSVSQSTANPTSRRSRVAVVLRSTATLEMRCSNARRRAAGLSIPGVVGLQYRLTKFADESC